MYANSRNKEKTARFEFLSTTALFDYISAGRSTHGAFNHWRPHFSSDCCIGLEQFAGVSPVIAVVASFPQQTENRTFCPVLQT